LSEGKETTKKQNSRAKTIMWCRGEELKFLPGFFVFYLPCFVINSEGEKVASD
jgi:hypothetical protein